MFGLNFPPKNVADFWTCEVPRKIRKPAMLSVEPNEVSAIVLNYQRSVSPKRQRFFQACIVPRSDFAYQEALLHGSAPLTPTQLRHQFIHAPFGHSPHDEYPATTWHLEPYWMIAEPALRSVEGLVNRLKRPSPLPTLSRLGWMPLGLKASS